MQAWETFIAEQEKGLGKAAVDRWLRTLRVIKFDARNLYLEAKDAFQALWFEEHIRPKIDTSLLNNNHRKIRVHLTVLGRPSTKKTAIATPTQPPLALTFDPLDPLCTFDNFVATKAHTVPYRVLTEQLTAYNPIYLYGPSGTGKSHLLMALAHQLQAQGIHALYARLETFTEHTVMAIRTGQMIQFRDVYRKVGALLLDNIHLLSRKWATQEELFHTFNTLHLAGKPIILSSHCPPSELQQIEPRLVSRFEWGIALPLVPIQEEERAILLTKKASAFGLELSDKVYNFLLSHFTSSAKALIRALEALVLRSHLHKTQPLQLTVALATHYLADLLALEKASILSPEKIIQHCASQQGIRPEDLLGKAQTRECALPRQVAMFLCRQKLKLPFKKIGELFSRDHSTVMSSVRLIDQALHNKDPETQTFVHAITQQMLF